MAVNVDSLFGVIVTGVIPPFAPVYTSAIPIDCPLLAFITRALVSRVTADVPAFSAVKVKLDSVELTFAELAMNCMFGGGWFVVSESVPMQPDTKL